jgi:hypothetical protein
VIALVLAGCYHPSFEQNVPCSAALTCPGDQVCDTTQSPPACVGQLGSGSNEIDGGNQADAVVSACGVCPSAMPVCDSGNTTCRGCYSDSECGSHVCSESTGSCMTDAQTLYVATTGDDANPCTHDLPCANVSRAVQLVDAIHDVIKIYDGDYNDSFITTGATFLLSGEGNDTSNATINFQTNVAANVHIMEIQGGTVAVEGLTFDGGAAESVRVQGGATLSMFSCEVLDSPIGSIDAQDSTLNLYDAQIHDGQGTEAAVNLTNGTLVMQRGLMYSLGGACIRATGAKYDVENSILTGCAAEGFAQAGALPSMAIFSFNTVVGNSVGVTCAVGITVKNSIFAFSTGIPPQTPACAAVTYSLFSDLAASGTGNIAGNPSFVATDDLHINFNSPARDKGDPNATARFDFDGEHRPHGSGFDIGADEHY